MGCPLNQETLEVTCSEEREAHGRPPGSEPVSPGFAPTLGNGPSLRRQEVEKPDVGLGGSEKECG